MSAPADRLITEDDLWDLDDWTPPIACPNAARGCQWRFWVDDNNAMRHHLANECQENL